MSETTKVKTVDEKISEEFTKFTSSMYAAYGEPKSMIMIVDWQNNEGVPAGVLTTREGTNADFTSIVIQLNKSIAVLVKEQLQSLMQLTKTHADLKREISDMLKKRTDILNGGPATGSPETTGPDHE